MNFISFPEFTEHQRNVFCVFSGPGVSSLRRHLNTDSAFSHLRDSTPTGHPRHPQNPVEFGYNPGLAGDHGEGAADTGFDEPERDAIEDDDGLDDSEMVLDAAPLAQNDPAPNLGGASLDASMIPPPPPPPPTPPPGPNVFQWNPPNHDWQEPHQHGHHHNAPPNSGHIATRAGYPPIAVGADNMQLLDAMDIATPRPSASSAPANSAPDAGPSTASLHAVTGDNTNSTHSHTPIELDRHAAEGLSRGSTP